ncbi:MAG: hypothetical protein JXQ99_11950 [Hyphomicrobiaceae bacterium]
MTEQDEDWIEPRKPRRDWKKVFLVLGLGSLSWVATYVGMLELIQANMGALDFTTKIVVGFSVAMLMTMIIWLLDQMFAPHPFAVKMAYVAGYIFLTIISVGFGFGFYWKVLESRSEASRSAESAVSQVQASLLAGSARLDQLQSTLEQLTGISQQKAIIERERGASCPNSRPGDGPRRRLRDDDAARFSFASNFVKGRSTKVKSDMRALDGDLKKISSSDPSTFDKATGTRNKFLQALSRKLELTATSFNAFRTDPQLRQIRSELFERANRSTFPTGRGNRTFSCPDGQLQSALLGVVRAIDQLPELGKPEIATVEGAQAVVEAFRRLTATGQGLLVLKLPPSADELRALQKKAVRSVSGRAPTSASSGGLSQGGLSQRDYIPLSIALFVDLCLLLVSIGRPMNRLGGLVPKMREAERGPVYQILSKFDAIHRDQKIREKFEVFRHVVFDFNGDYYVAVPLDAPRNRNPDEVKNLQLEAHLLSNLFASFEKEKIFSRVYNPLLSRKTIQKKLWRQGSKFAASQAFRTYRFRDGAWSDIILGAVMGAARRARTDRIREAEEAGPQLDLPETVSGKDAETRAREIIAATVGAQTAELKDQLGEEPFTDGRPSVDPDADAERMAAAFGPYADRVRQSDERDPRARSWPYMKPPAGPSEADVDLLPANSNTSPSHVEASDVHSPAPYERDDANPGVKRDDSDNVILMPPRPAPPPIEDAISDYALPVRQKPIADAVPYTDILAHAIATPNEEPESDAQAEYEPSQAPSVAARMQSIEEPVVEPAVLPDNAYAQPVQEPGIETSMNVRITQRTADFQIPISGTSNGQPIEFVRAGMRTTFGTQGSDQLQDASAQDQLALDFKADHGIMEMQPAPKPKAIAAGDQVIVAEVITPDFDTAQIDGDDASPGNIGAPDHVLSDDALGAISRRFAPKQADE